MRIIQHVFALRLLKCMLHLEKSLCCGLVCFEFSVDRQDFEFFVGPSCEASRNQSALNNETVFMQVSVHIEIRVCIR